MKADKYSLEFELEGLPETINQMIRMRQVVYRKKKNAWKEKVGIVVGHRVPNSPLEQATVILTRFSSVYPDFDGLVSSFKHILDGLVDAGILEDDKPKNFKGDGPVYRWQKIAPKMGKIKVEVVEV